MGHSSSIFRSNSDDSLTTRKNFEAMENSRHTRAYDDTAIPICGSATTTPGMTPTRDRSYQRINNTSEKETRDQKSRENSSALFQMLNPELLQLSNLLMTNELERSTFLVFMRQEQSWRNSSISEELLELLNECDNHFGVSSRNRNFSVAAKRIYSDEITSDQSLNFEQASSIDEAIPIDQLRSLVIATLLLTFFRLRASDDENLLEYLSRINDLSQTDQNLDEVSSASSCNAPLYFQEEDGDPYFFHPLSVMSLVIKNTTNKEFDHLLRSGFWVPLIVRTIEELPLPCNILRIIPFDEIDNSTRTACTMSSLHEGTSSVSDYFAREYSNFAYRKNGDMLHASKIPILNHQLGEYFANQTQQDNSAGILLPLKFSHQITNSEVNQEYCSKQQLLKSEAFFIATLPVIDFDHRESLQQELFHSFKPTSSIKHKYIISLYNPILRSGLMPEKKKAFIRLTDFLLVMFGSVLV